MGEIERSVSGIRNKGGGGGGLNYYKTSFLSRCLGHYNVVKVYCMIFWSNVLVHKNKRTDQFLLTRYDFPYFSIIR